MGCFGSQFQNCFATKNSNPPPYRRTPPNRKNHPKSTSKLSRNHPYLTRLTSRWMAKAMQQRQQQTK